MNAQQIQLKQAAKIAVIAMLLLLLGAFRFYKERMLFIDAAHICFRLLNYKTFVIEEHRYGSFITQLVPLIGQKLHLSLKAILIAYSASFNLFYLAIVCLLLFRYKQYSLAVLMALYYVLFVSDAYYWTNNEVHQGTAWMFLFFAVAFRNAEKQPAVLLQVLSFIILAALAIFTHPLVMISIIFLWGYFFINKEQWPYSRSSSVLFSALLVMIVLLKYFVSRVSHGYDSGKIDLATQLNPTGIWHALKAPMTKTFFHDCIYNYWLILLIFLTGIVILIKERKWPLLLWTLLFTIGFYTLMALTYGNSLYDRHTLFYMESEWMSFSLILAAPFVFNFLPCLQARNAAWLLAFIFIVRFTYILEAAPVFTARIAFIERGLQQMRKKGLTKLVLIKENNSLDDKLLMAWGLPDESLMASVMDGDRPARTFTEMPPEQLAKGVPKDHKTMIASFQLVNEKLNRKYFPIDTTGAYQIMTWETFNK